MEQFTTFTVFDGAPQQQFDFLDEAASPPSRIRHGLAFTDELRGFKDFGTATLELATKCAGFDGVEWSTPTFVNEFWTAGQRQAHSLHEVSYRACFKPQLPRFFIERLTDPGEVVYDPFMGRGTTLLEAALLGRTPVGNDINPLSLALLRPRIHPPRLTEIETRLREIPWETTTPIPEDLLVFYHPDTLREMLGLKEYLLSRQAAGQLDSFDEWIRMVAVNRLTGHSPGFFSVYTLPPNQAVSIKSQIKINAARNQVPPRRDVPKLTLKKSKQLLKELDEPTRTVLRKISSGLQLVNSPAAETKSLASGTVSLVVTSPPFLDVVDYAGNNWLRCWFMGIDPATVKLTVPKKVELWEEEMTRVFVELNRVLRPGGHIAFEVGEVMKGKVKLEESVLRCGRAAGLDPELVLINQQEFTKTANCWGVDNNGKGTNTNRIVLFTKSA